MEVGAVRGISAKTGWARGLQACGMGILAVRAGNFFALTCHWTKPAPTRGGAAWPVLLTHDSHPSSGPSSLLPPISRRGPSPPAVPTAPSLPPEHFEHDTPYPNKLLVNPLPMMYTSLRSHGFRGHTGVFRGGNYMSTDSTVSAAATARPSRQHSLISLPIHDPALTPVPALTRYHNHST